MSDQNWSIKKALATYNTDYWSDGYFSLNEAGGIEVKVPCGADGQLYRGELKQLLDKALAAGLRPPILFRFGDILRDRVEQMSVSFKSVAERIGFKGAYTSVYPIKVNQQRRVVEQILSAHSRSKGVTVGLEAGSKPELLAVLALAPAEGGLVICNGYKDREYIRLALIGQKMGLQVTIVVEKLSELPIILQEAEALQVAPKLGVRVRLNSVGKGKWQNTGGQKAKFGLQASQLLRFIQQLKEQSMLESLQMVHFHMGSQVSDAQDIQQCVAEAARYYIELKQMGAPLSQFDVGGGLGVDYEGTRSRSYFSMNYTLDEYAYHILQPIKEACDQHGYEHPMIITESGRGLTAHHAVLITDVVATESMGHEQPSNPDDEAPSLMRELYVGYQRTQLELSDREAVELYHQLEHLMQQAQEKYKQSQLNLSQWAEVEQCYYAACRNMLSHLSTGLRAHQIILDELNELLAEKFFVNFSLFQSLPDAWGIGQVFPVMPLENLDQQPGVRAVIHDMTCDSDGRIDQYVDGMGLESTLPLPAFTADKPYYLSFFMVGAYQEILGDMHNLFGDTDSVDVTLAGDNQFILSHPTQGDTVDSVLKYVNFDPDQLYRMVQVKMQGAIADAEERRVCIAEISEGLRGYTYLE